MKSTVCYGLKKQIASILELCLTHYTLTTTLSDHIDSAKTMTFSFLLNACEY